MVHKIGVKFRTGFEFLYLKIKTKKKTENKIYRQQNSNFDKMAKNQTIEENLSVPNSYNLQISKKEMTTTHHFKTYIVSFRHPKSNIARNFLTSNR